MRQSVRNTVIAALAASANAATNSTSSSLANVCTISNVQAALPANGTLNGINLIPSSVTVNSVNATATGYTYCNVTVSYEHPGKDTVVVWYNFPSPEDFVNRFYVGGGGGYSLSADPTGGLAYGAVGGVTDAGYGAIAGTSLDDVVLTGNGSVNWDAVYMFAYQGLGEMTQIGKAITPLFYGLDTNTKIYTYFEGCSDGGREGWSQIQRYGAEYDGAITGAPAMRYGQQQVNHLFSNVAEVTMNYFPPTCEMEQIVNMTIAACDPLDGRTDGVVSRTDLCKLNFNVNSTIGAAYSCAATTSSSLGFGFGQRKRQMGPAAADTPAQNGTVSAEGAALAATLWDGLFTTTGKRAYLPWSIASSFQDATAAYDSTTETWGVDIASTGGEFVTKFIQLLDLDNLSSLSNVTYDTLVEWMDSAMVMYMDSLQTTLPDVTTFQEAGGKIIHYHGESDDSIPPSSSVRYYNSVRSVMYPAQSYRDSIASIQEWYKLFLIPGAAHCSANTLQPGPYPQDNMQTMIDWVEGSVEPIAGLNATVASGTYSGEVQQLCAFPLRPLWSSNSTMLCVYDQASIDSWDYTLDAFKMPVY